MSERMLCSRMQEGPYGWLQPDDVYVGPFTSFQFPLIRKKWPKMPDFTSPESGSGADLLNEVVAMAKGMGYTPVIGHEDGTREPLTAESVVRALSRKRRGVMGNADGSK